MRFVAKLAGAALALGLMSGSALGQHAPPDLGEQRAAMARFAGLVGQWQGEAVTAGPNPAVVHQTERVERALDGLLLVVNGAGYATPDRAGAPVFQAMAVISYDDRRDAYEFRAYTHQGYASTGAGEFLADGSFRWTPTPGGESPVRMRFTIRFDESAWRETGEMSRDGGQTWTPTLEMNLRRAP